MCDFESNVIQYVQADSGVCPFCGSDDVDYGGGDFGSEASQEASCSSCGSEWRDLYTLHGINVERVGKKVKDGKKISLGEHIPEQLFLLVMVGDVEPEIRGPFKTDEERLAAAREYRAEEGMDDGLYRLNVRFNGATEVSPFFGDEMEIDEGDEK